MRVIPEPGEDTKVFFGHRGANAFWLQRMIQRHPRFFKPVDVHKHEITDIDDMLTFCMCRGIKIPHPGDTLLLVEMDMVGDALELSHGHTFLKLGCDT